ncbi:MAG: sugar phosphate isomerase/epimerase, partial [Kiritimatiellae bacterium]|nr:sugar phosphate isomerase/epimerase [Kiritimatiellia bacterium]
DRYEVVMELSVTTDYQSDTGDPSPYLRRIAEAGFTHVHWCHHWNTDFVYSKPEIEQIRKWLRTFGLRLLDLHGSVGPEKNWGSVREYERLAGVELVKNRLEMTAALDGDVVIMHLPQEPNCDATRRSLDALERLARHLGVRIALENGRFDEIGVILAEYSPLFIGLCYDSGHGNLIPDGLDRLSEWAHRLISVHLHDNDGREDQHRLPFTGTVDWERLAGIIARSAYSKCVSMEVSMRRSGWTDEERFLSATREAGIRLSGLIAAARREASGLVS